MTLELVMQHPELLAEAFKWIACAMLGVALALLLVEIFASLEDRTRGRDD
jgi:hypothetical protein